MANDLKMFGLSQTEVNYTPDYTGADGRCASCRWFMPTENECHLVMDYPLVILPTGRCDRQEIAPTDEPDTLADVPMAMGTMEAKDTHTVWDVGDGTITTGTIPGVTVTVKPNLLDKAVHAVKSLFAGDALTEGFKVSGNHWLAVWSNNFEDLDGEWFPTKAQDDYVYRVDTSLVPPPELWVYHVPGTKIGQADWVGREGHFMFAFGTFDDTPAAQHAKAFYTKNAKHTSLSHGFNYDPTQFVQKQYHQFNTFEITLLPRGAEANRYTSLEGVKAMALSEQKRAHLKKVFGEEVVEQLFADYDKAGKALVELGKAYKEFATDPRETLGETEAVNQAVKDADENFSDVFVDMIGEHAEIAEATAAAAKEINHLRGVIASQDKAHKDELTAMRKDIDALRSEMQLRPRAASTAADTVVPDDGKLSEAVRKDIERQTTRKDAFWGTTVSDVEGR